MLANRIRSSAGIGGAGLGTAAGLGGALAVGRSEVRAVGSAAGVGAAAAVAFNDPYYANVVALLHFNGTDASTTFTDEKGHTFTPAGNAQIDTAQSKFGGASGLFDGTGDYISTPSSADFAYGTGDFTWEGWIRFATTAADQYFLDHGSNGGMIQYQAGTLRYYNPTTGTGSALYTPGGGALTAGVWYHIAATRSSGTTRLFVDGVLKASASDSHNYGSQTLRFGGYGGGGYGLNGWLDDARITKGVARYTANFTPPSQEFPNG